MSTATIPTATSTAPLGSAPAPSLLRLTQVELRKTRDTRAGFWLLLVVVLTTVAAVALLLFAGETQDRTLDTYFAITQLPISLLLPVLGILLVTSEWSQRTAMTTFALVPARSRVLTAKVLAATVLSVLGVAAAAVVSALGALLTPVLTSDTADWSISGAQVGQALVAQVITVLVGVAFGMLLLSSPLAIVLYFVLPTVVTIISNTVGALTWMRDWLDLGTTLAPMYDGTLDAQGWAQVATSFAVWGIAPLVAGWVRIERSEIG
jgi:ABC-type transport system involved in multi-copper enzyme maturation permease subunit